MNDDVRRVAVTSLGFLLFRLVRIFLLTHLTFLSYVYNHYMLLFMTSVFVLDLQESVLTVSRDTP